jgi:hypothetical protein
MTDLILRKHGQILIADDAQGAIELETIKNGVYKVKITKPRNIKFHRKYFALLNLAFENWDVDGDYKNFDVFRKNIAILAGFYKQAYNLQGVIVLEAVSIDFSSMDDVQFEKLFSASIDVILKHVLKNYKRDDLDRLLMDILRFD